MEADEEAEAKGGGGARAAHALVNTTPRRESASAPAPPSRETPPTALVQRHGELWCEPALSGRPAAPPPPSGESEEEGGDVGGDASPAPAPQANDIPTANDIPALSGRLLTRTGAGFDELRAVPVRDVDDGHFSGPRIHGTASDEAAHSRGAQTRDLAQHIPAVGEAAADRSAGGGGDEAAAAGDDANAGAHVAGAATEAEEGAEAEGGGAREARTLAKTTPRRESASAPAPPSRKRPRSTATALALCMGLTLPDRPRSTEVGSEAARSV